MTVTQSVVGMALSATLLLPGLAQAQLGSDVYVQGHVRTDGTYVQPHWRSAPDGIRANNYSYPGNVNPYTGQLAPGDPIRPQQYDGGLYGGGTFGTQPRDGGGIFGRD